MAEASTICRGRASGPGKTLRVREARGRSDFGTTVAALLTVSITLDEIVAAKPTAAYDAKWGGFFINGEFFI